MSKRTTTSHSPGDGDLPALYAKVKQMIVTRIHDGDWRPGDRLPSENDLVRDLGVSRMTINRALRELSIEGVIVRAKGVGSFVAEAKPYAELLEVRNIAEEILQRGHRYTALVVVATTELATPQVAINLGLAAGAPVFHTVIVHHENELPVQLEDRFVNPAASPEYLDHDFTVMTPNAILSTAAPLTQAEHIVEAVLPSAREGRLLAIAETEPCLLIQRRTWSNDLAVSVARLLYPGARYRLRGRHMAGGHDRAG